MADSDRTQAALYNKLKPFDVAERDVTRIAPLQLPLGFQFVHGLLVRTPGLLKLPVGLHDIDPRHHEVRFDLRDLATRSLLRGLLLRTVQSEDRLSLGDPAIRPACTSATRPLIWETIGTVLKNNVTLVVDGWL